MFVGIGEDNSFVPVHVCRSVVTVYMLLLQERYARGIDHVNLALTSGKVQLICPRLKCIGAEPQKTFAN